MKIEDCKECSYHNGIKGDSVLCYYLQDLQSRVFGEQSGQISVISCPRDENEES